jgi:hypothetical protein
MTSAQPTNASTRWVACIDAAEAPALAALRLIPGLEVASVGEVVWLRGPGMDDALALGLQKIPGLRRFTLQADGQLIADGTRVPKGRLTAAAWSPLRDGQRVALPHALGATGSGNRAPLQLARSAAELPANALLTDLHPWHAWAETAPEIRLRPLRFAAASDGRVWIEGTPLPGVAGRRYHLREGVAVPCGFACSPDLGAPALRRWLALAEGDTAFSEPEGSWEILRSEQFVPALRSAVRATMEASGDV